MKYLVHAHSIRGRGLVLALVIATLTELHVAHIARKGAIQ